MENKPKYHEAQPDVPTIQLSKDEQSAFTWWRTELERMREDRETIRDEFNGLSYSDFYDECENKAEARALPIKNTTDRKLTTGTTKNKVRTQVSALLGYNFQKEIVTYDDTNTPLAEISEAMERMLDKSEELEDYNVLKPLIYQEAVKHGTFFTEELWEERWDTIKIIDEMDVENIDKMTWTNKVVKLPGIARTKLYAGKQVYLGNIHEFFIQNQPRIAIVEVIPRDQAEQVFGEWERWKYVDYKGQDVSDLVETSGLGDWSLTDTKDNEVEMIKIQDKVKQSYQIILNGVPMLKEGFPLKAISVSGEYTIAKGDVGSATTNFAYSTPLPADMIVDQNVMDRMIRAFITKTEQSTKPPMGTKGDIRPASTIFDAGSMVTGMAENELFPIIDTPGVTNAEMNMFKILQEIVDDKSSDPIMSGQEAGDMTLGEYEGRIKQQKMQLGSALIGIMNYHKQAAWLRLQTINDKWTEKVDYEIKEGESKDLYRTITVDTPEDNDYDRQIIKLDPKRGADLSESYSEKVLQEENDMKRTKITYIDPIGLRRLKMTFNINIVAKPTESTELEKTMLLQNTGALANFGIMPNPSVLTKIYTNMAKLPQELYNNNQQAVIPQGGQQEGKLEGQMKPKVQQPSINTLKE